MNDEDLAKGLEELPGTLPLVAACLILLVPLLVWLRRASARRRGLLPQEPPLWSWRDGLLLLLLWFLAQVAIGIPLIAPLGGGESSAEAGALVELAVSLGSWCLALSATVWVVCFRCWQPLSVLGLRPVPGSWLAASAASYALLFIPLGVLSIAWAWVLRQGLGLAIEPQEAVQSFTDAVESGSWTAVALRAATAAVIAPVCEEVLFRGVIEGGFRASGGPRLALWASSIVFAAVHFSLLAFVPLLVLGWVLGWLRQTTGSLAPAIVFHALFNAVSLLLLAAR